MRFLKCKKGNMATNPMIRTENYKFSFMTGTQPGLQPAIVAGIPRNVLRVERSTQNKQTKWQSRQLQLALMQASIRKEERKLIGQELHDNVNQILGVVKMMVEMLKPCSD